MLFPALIVAKMDPHRIHRPRTPLANLGYKRKPCAGEPHARIDGRELETEPALVTVTEKNDSVGNHRGRMGPIGSRKRPDRRAVERRGLRGLTTVG